MCLSRYLDNVVNNQTAAAPIPHPHARLTTGEDPPDEMDIFSLIKSSYEVGAPTRLPPPPSDRLSGGTVCASLIRGSAPYIPMSSSR